MSGGRIGSVWSDCPAMRANTPLISETTGYPTQKPEKLLERIVLAASQEGSAVLNPMCGSGTTVAVAARLGRRFVGIDQSEVAFENREEAPQRACTCQAQRVTLRSARRAAYRAP
ncbi:MAG: site-specific DNA-methyltransferase [Polyangiaceae bacterium]